MSWEVGEKDQVKHFCLKREKESTFTLWHIGNWLINYKGPEKRTCPYCFELPSKGIQIASLMDYELNP
jgi:hypothetical protein